MIKRQFAAFAVAASLLVGSIGLPAIGASAAATCTGTFTANITSGRDAGSSIVGRITLPAGVNGHITGTLVEGGQTIPVAGRIEGTEIHLHFTTSTGTVRGKGQLPGAGNACSGNFGGAFHGPGHHDKGDWGIIWGSSPTASS